MNFLKRFTKGLLDWLVSLLLVGMVITIFIQVIYRYVFNNPLSWSEELARYIFIWITFLGTFLALKSNAHISIDALIKRFSPGKRSITEIVVTFFIIFYLIYLIQLGFNMTKETVDVYSPALHIPFSYIYVVIPLSGVLMIFYLFFQLYHSTLRRVILSGIASAVILLAMNFIFSGRSGASGSLITICIVFLVVLIVINTPIAFSIGLSTLIFLDLQQRVPLVIVPTRMLSSSDSFPLLAVPFFILAGELMNTGGITQRLINFAKVLVGHIRGGLGMVVVVGEYFFSGISGSTIADVSAIGALLIPAMKKAGYKPENAVAITAAASAMGILVPPCIAMVVLGGMTGISVGALFIGGFIPAIVIALCIMALIYFQAVRSQMPAEKRLPLNEALKSVVNAIIPLILPIIIFLGIITGAATATEISVVCVVYAFIVGTFIYKEIRLNQIIQILVGTSTTTGVVMFLLATSSVLSWMFATNQIHQKIGDLIVHTSSYSWVFLILSNLTFILLGAALEGLPAIIILIPIFLPLIGQFGINPIHYCILSVAALGMGLFLPPIGVGLFIACSFGEVSITKASSAFIPYLIVLFIGLLIISFFPWFTMVLPNIVFPTG